MKQQPLPDKAQLNKLVASPSLGSVIYQARSLIQELNRLNDEEYPPQACRIRDIFLSFAEYILDRLVELYDPENPHKVKGTGGLQRLRIFAEALQEIYANIRYLWASSPSQTPPELQEALAQLMALHFPSLNGEPLCVVRPQWKYNLKYVPLSLQLKQLVAPGVLDPSQEHGINSKDSIIPLLWKRWRDGLGKEAKRRVPPKPPKHFAVLSFAGLDTEDPLLYPLLAHEIGHFIDHSYTPQLHLDSRLRRLAEVDMSEIFKILDESREEAGWQNPWLLHELLTQRIFVCLQELIADLLAARMLGLAFFVSQSEFLKTLYAWPGPKILPSGYPGIRFRLKVIFDHITGEEGPLNVRHFLEGHASDQPGVAGPLLYFLMSWERRLTGAEKAAPKWHGPSDTQRQVDGLIERAVVRSLPTLIEIARNSIPNEVCARLTPRFFDRVAKLEKELPPCFDAEDKNCLAEIMSAAWTYQMLFGERREALKKDLDESMAEYRKTCRLVLKALQLLPALQSSPTKGRASRAPRADGPRPPGRLADGDEGRWLIRGGVLGAPQIKHRLGLPISDLSALTVVPSRMDNVQAASLDVHLGNWFTVYKRTNFKGIHLGPKGDPPPRSTPKEEVFVPFGKSFLIHPGDLVLSATLEFLGLPADLMAFVDGRSTLGRQGLLINTAATVAPGFHGVVVLELANTGAVAIEVSPGMAIAQVMFQVLAEPLLESELYRGQYYCQIKP